MKNWTFRTTIETDVEAETEMEAREDWIQSVTELGIGFFVLPKDLEFVSSDDAEEE